MKSTKKALLLSMMSMLLCVAMLMGTTFAWFTDKVESGVNEIVAGNLDVELYHTNKAVTKEKVTETTQLFKDVTLWEPGAVAYETLTVANVGTLALNYQMSILVDNEVKEDGHGLSEVLKVGTISGGLESGATRESIIGQISDWSSLASFTKNGSLDANTEDTPVTYVIYWQPGDNDNLYNMNNENKGKELSIDLGVKLVAGQKAREVDSFDEKYDLSAFIQVNPDNVKDVLANLKDGDNLYLAAGGYTPSVTDMFRIEKNDVTIVGAGKDTVLNCTMDLSGMAGVLICGDNVTIANLTVKTASNDGNVAAVRFSDMTDGAIVNGGKLENITVIGSMGHGINVQGAKDVIINNVDVQSYGKCGISFGNASATVTNTKIAAGGWGSDIGCMYKANNDYINPCSITIGEGNDFANGKIYSERPTSANNGKDVITFADPSDWVKTDNDNGWTAVAAVAKIDATGYATLQDAVNAATVNDTVVILKDVTLSELEKIIIPAEAQVSIDGNGHTVSFAKTAAFSVDKNAKAFSLKNTKVVKIGSQAGYAVVTPHGFHGSVAVDSCTLKNLKYGVYMDPTDSTENHATLSITNCAYDNTVWGYCFDNRPIVTTNVTVTFKDNTGIADDHIQESFA